jgi:hypothetical protein
MDSQNKFEKMMRSLGKEINVSLTEDLETKRSHIAQAMSAVRNNKQEASVPWIWKLMSNYHVRVAIPVLALGVLAIVFAPDSSNLDVTRNVYPVMIEAFEETADQNEDLEVAENYFNSDLGSAHEEFAEDILAFEFEGFDFNNNNWELDEDEGSI